MQRCTGLVPFSSDLRTRWGMNGLAWGARGRVPDTELRTVGDHARITGRQFKGSRGTVKAWSDLNEAWVASGGEPLRLTSTYRDQHQQRELRERFEAGKGPPANRPNESHHGWGGAIDFHARALHHRDAANADEALAMLWECMEPFGFRPIIRVPRIDMAESWHVERLGPLLAYERALRASGQRRAYSWTARAGCALLLTSSSPRVVAEAAQAMLGLWAVQTQGEPLRRPFPGAADGIIGPKTRRTAEAAGVWAPTPAEIVRKMTDAGMVDAQLEEL